MLLSLLAVVVGLGLLLWGSDRFVVGASATARNIGVSPLVIGLTVVGIGTSAPEILVSAAAAWQSNPGVGVGNAVGSNIANIGLILGFTALLTPLGVRSEIFKREFPLMFAIIVLAFLLLLDGSLGRIDGAILLTGFFVLLGSMVGIALKARKTDPLADEYEHEIPATLGTFLAVLWLIVGLVALLLGSRAVVWGAVNIARALQVSDLLIGLTIVAVGTSLPELAASVTSARKGEPDIAIGNVIGSNMFNMLPVLGLPGLIAPGEVQAEVLYRDFPVMLGLSVVLFSMAYGFRGPGRIQRWEGGALLLAFCAYQTLLYFSAT